MEDEIGATLCAPAPCVIDVGSDAAHLLLRSPARLRKAPQVSSLNWVFAISGLLALRALAIFSPIMIDGVGAG